MRFFRFASLCVGSVPVGLVALALSLGTRAAAGQGAAAAGATVTGVVRERLNDVPLALATVALDGGDRVVLTRGGGTFAIVGVAAGRHTLRVRQIGDAPTTLAVTVPDSGAVDAGVARLERLAASLATVEVRAQPSECRGTGLSDPGADSMAAVVFSRLGDQSDRLRAFAATYPIAAMFTTTRETLDADSAVLSTKVDSGSGRLLVLPPYRVGGVVVKESLHNIAVRLPGAEQLSSTEFVAHHCARYAGTRVVGADTLDVLDIAPTRDVRSTDVAGLVLLTRSGVLRRTELRLTNAGRASFGPFFGHLNSFAVTTTFRPIRGGMMSVPAGFTSVQEVRVGVFGGAGLRRLRHTWRPYRIGYMGASPEADAR